MEKRVNFEISYGGKFIGDSDLQYVGGVKELLKGVDPDYISIIELKDVVVSAGFTDMTAIYYKFPKTNLALRQKLVTDLDVNDMTDMMYDGDLVEIYVEHETEVNLMTGATNLDERMNEVECEEQTFTADIADKARDKCTVNEAENVEAFDIVSSSRSWERGDEIVGELTDFSDPEMEHDKEDLFCLQDENIERARIHISKSLNEIFSTSALLSGQIDDDVDYQYSDDLVSDFSEDENIQREYPFFNEKTDFGKNISLVVGMQFRNKDAYVYLSKLDPATWSRLCSQGLLLPG